MISQVRAAVAYLQSIAQAGLPGTPSVQSTLQPNYIAAYTVPAAVEQAATWQDAINAGVQSIQQAGGAPVSIRYEPPAPAVTFGNVLNTILGVVGLASSPTQLAQAAVKPTVQPAPSQLSFAPTGGTKMGLFDDIWGSATGPGGIFNANNGVNWGGLLNIGTQLAQNAFAPQPSSMPMPSTGPMAVPAMASVPAIVGRAGAVVGRGFFNRFPNLATAIQGLRNTGQNVSRAKLYGVMKRFGPEFLVSGGLLTAAAVNELAVAGPGYRRMNPANVRALRRSVRRIESFHRLCKHTDTLRSRGARKKRY